MAGYVTPGNFPIVSIAFVFVSEMMTLQPNPRKDGVTAHRSPGPTPRPCISGAQSNEPGSRFCFELKD